MNLEEQQDLTLDLPRILCLHGGGVNAKVFRQQSRGLIKQLKSHFRLVFADGPFFCKPGPGIVPVYENHGPFRRWMRWLPEQPECDARTAAKRIDRQIKQAMDEDDEQGATGEWVGLLGFSQGAKLAASMLFMQQKRAELLGENMAGSNFRFAVIMAGRAPLVTFDTQLVMSPGLADLAEISVESPEEGLGGKRDHLLRLPTVHVHGRQDQGLHLHRRLLDQYCEPGSARLVEWDGNHRIPFKPKDVALIVDQILDVSRETGALDQF